MSEWQEVTDTEPAPGKGVLLTAGKSVFIGWRADLRHYKKPERANKWRSFDPNCTQQPTHWMQLPQPPFRSDDARTALDDIAQMDHEDAQRATDRPDAGEGR